MKDYKEILTKIAEEHHASTVNLMGALTKEDQIEKLGDLSGMLFHIKEMTMLIGEAVDIVKQQLKEENTNV